VPSGYNAGLYNNGSIKVSNPVSYEGGGSVLVIPVDTDFVGGDTLTISGLNFMTFATATAPLPGLKLFTGGASDQVADATNGKTITIKGKTTGAEHAAGQVTNAIDQSGSTLSSLLLYAFNLTLAGGENMNITNLPLTLSGIQGIASGDITNAKLYVDYNGNKVVDAGDTQVGGTGAVSVNTDGTGFITFSSAFTATTSRNYLLQADIGSVGFGDSLTIAITPSNVTASGLTSLLSTTPASTVALSSAQHVKIPRGGGEVAGSAPPPAGQGPPGGTVGGNKGGGATTTIGSDPDFFPPTTSGGTFNQWTTPDNALTSNDLNATAASSWFREDYGGFGFSVPSTNTISGIEVKLELSGTTAAGTVSVALSWDGGNSTTTTLKTSPTLATGEAVITLGSPSDTWGHPWLPAEFSDANFKVRLVAQPSSNTVKVDAIQVNVHDIATGGGHGGGGEALTPTKGSLRYANLASVYNAGHSLFLAGSAFTTLFVEKFNDILTYF
jgi:hypothetical protein